MQPIWAEWCASRICGLSRDKVLRSLRTVEPGRGASLHVAEATLAQWAADEPSTGDWGTSASPPCVPTCELVSFSSNDYLGLGAHRSVRAAAASAAARHGCGPRSSALLCGYTTMHRELESGLASLKGTEEALLFPTGYAANLSVLGTLLTGGGGGSGVELFSDELNHASIIDGARLATRGAGGAALSIYRHADYEHLEKLLRASEAPLKVIVSESLFSMDGDPADVPRLATLRKEHGALLVLDEAHASLTYGSSGGGVAEAAGVSEQVDVHVGTLSKAFGSHGGFVACSAALKQLLLSTGRAGMFSTALPAPAVAAASAALRHATPRLRAQLWHNVKALEAATGLRATAQKRAGDERVGAWSLREGGLPMGSLQRCSPIFPVIIGSSADALAVSSALLGLGLHVPAIRPPTVAQGSARLRIAVSATHTAEQIERLARALQKHAPAAVSAAHQIAAEPPHAQDRSQEHRDVR